MHAQKLQIIRNVGSSWSALAVNVAVGIFLSPFILHRLGDAAFGVWVLIFSVTGYYGLFDLGIRSSIIRYVSKYTATDDREKLTQFVNTALFSYTGIGVVSMGLTALLSSSVEHLFKIPPEMHSQARLLLLMVGASVSLGFPLGVFGGMLEGLQRFYILNWTSIGATLARAALIVYFLNRGYGLLTVALLTVGLPLFSSILRGIVVFRLCPVPLGLKHVDRASFRHMANYGGTTFLVLVASRLRFRTDELVLGTMMSTVAVAWFNIGARIVDYAQEFVSSLAQVFVPMSSESEAKGNLDRVRKIYVAGNRACAFLILPITAILIIMGKHIIRIWVGARYIPHSYPVLVVMIIPFTLMLSQAASARVLFGLGKHQILAAITVIEGIANLMLSIALVPPLGIVGDALGTAIPLSFTCLVFLPRHMKKQIGVPVRTFLHEAYTLPILLTLPLVAVLWLANQFFYPRNLIQLALEILAVSPIYGVGLLWAYRTNRAFHVAKIAGLTRPSPPEQLPQAVVSVEYQNEQ
ncbi:MAG: flippase [Terriglobales bacterium]|jgi:O-antigen/teichoic acid export membrane protein